MATQAELEFLLKMRDEATASFRKLTSAIDQAAKGADGLGDSTDQAGAKLDNLIKKAKEATVAFGAIFATGVGAKKAINDFSSYENSMLKVQRLTKQTKDEMREFEEELAQAVRELGGVDPKTVAGFTAIGGQLGLARSEVLEFGTAMTKLDSALNIGESGAVSIGRLLNLTGELKEEGAAAVTTFGNALAAIQNTTKASADELVEMASMLAQATAQFDFGSDSLLGIGAAMAQLDLSGQGAASAIQRAMSGLDDAAKLGGEAMRALTRETGITRDQLRELIQIDPSQAFTALLTAVDELQARGQSATPFLEAFGLASGNDVKVLGTLATNVKDVEKKIKEARAAAQQGGVFDGFFGDFAQQTSSFTQNFTNAIKEFSVEVGRALAPVYKVIVGTLTDAIRLATDAFKVLPEWGRTVLATSVIVASAIKPMLVAFGMIGPVISTAAKTFATFSGIGMVLKAAFGIVPGIVGGAVKAFMLIPAAIKSVRVAIASLMMMQSLVGTFGLVKVAAAGLATALKGLSLASFGILGLLAGAGIAVYNYWDDIKKAAADGWKSVTETLSSWWNGKQEVPKVAVEADVKSAKKVAKELKEEVEKELGEMNVQINAKDFNALKSFLPDIGDTAELQKQEDALKEMATTLQEIRDSGRGGKLFDEASGTVITEEHVERARRLLEIRRQMAADPLFDATRNLEDQLDDAAAVNVEMKNQLELHRAIRTAVEETGLAWEEVEDRMSGAMQQLQQARQQTALADQFRDLDHSIQMAAARTTAEEQRLEVLKKINDFEREHGKLAEADRASLEQRLTLLNQMTDAKRMMDQYDPVGSAQQRYQAELKTLEALREQNIISAEMFNRMKGNLDRQTQASRDPVGNRIREMREELSLMQYTGKQRQIEQTVLQEANRLKDQGVTVTKEMNQALREYATAMQQARDAESQGLAGWAESVGTLEDNLMKLQENFADGLADAISGAISGDAGSFRKFAANLGKQMVNMAVRQLMADAIKGMGNPAKDAATARADAALQKLDALSSAGINAPQAVVNAGTVNVNGQGLPGSSGASPLDSNYARQEFPELSAVNGQVQQLQAANDNLISAQQSAASATAKFSSSMGESVKALPALDGIKIDTKPIELAPKNLPEVSIPEVKLPEISVPQAQVPEMKFSQIDMPKVDVPKVQVPEIRMPEVQIPKAQMPEIQMPKNLTGDMKQAFSGLAGSGSIDFKPIQTAISTRSQEALNLAATQIGKHEIFNRSEVNSFLKAGNQNIDAAQTAWCAGFVNSSLEQVGIRGLSGDSKYVANQFRKWGEKVDPSQVLPGDVLVKHNNKGFSTGGHVGFATGRTRQGKNGMEMEMLSGNASNRVQLDWYKANQLEVRRATEEMAKQQQIATDTQIDQLKAIQQQPQQLTQALQGPSSSEAFFAQPQNLDQQLGSFAQAQKAPEIPTVDTAAIQQSQQQMQQFNQTMQQTGQTVPQVTQPMQQLQQTSTMTTGSLQQTGTSMTSFGQQTQMASTSVQSAAPSMSMLGMNTQMAGTSASQAGNQFQQAGSQIQAAGAQASSAGASAGGATGGFGGLESALGGLMGPINQATGGLGSLAQSIISFISQIGQSSGGMGGGGGLFGGLFSIFGFAEGGEVKGPGNGTSDSILARVSNGEFVVNAAATKKNLPLLRAINDNKPIKDLPKFAKGGLIGGKASNVVSIGERALGRTGKSAQGDQVAQLIEQVNKMTDRMNQDRSRSNSITNQSVNVTVNARDADSFRKSEAQLMTDAGFRMQRMTKRNG